MSLKGMRRFTLKTHQSRVHIFPPPPLTHTQKLIKCTCLNDFLPLPNSLFSLAFDPLASSTWGHLRNSAVGLCAVGCRAVCVGRINVTETPKCATKPSSLALAARKAHKGG